MRSQIASSGFGFMSASGVATVGAPKVGTVEPPGITVAVPVGETNMMLELLEPAVAQAISQNVTVETTSVGAVHGPDVAWPLASNRRTTVELRSGSTIF